MAFCHFYSENEFENIVREHLDMFHALALRILKNATEAEDAVQTALLRGWKRRFFLQTPEKLVGWLGRIVINESYDILRRRVRCGMVPWNLQLEQEHEAREAGTESAVREMRMRKLEGAIAALPEKYRQAVNIALLGGMESKEAAALLGCSVNALYQRIFQAKQLLREALKNE